MIIINIITYIIFLLFIIFLTIYLYLGSTIYDLIVFSNYNDIYNILENNLKTSFEKQTFVNSQSNNYIIETNTIPKLSLINNKIIIESSLYDTQSLDIFNDVNKIVPTFCKIKNFTINNL